LDLSATIHLLGETLGEVLRAQESSALFGTEERIRAAGWAPAPRRTAARTTISPTAPID